MSPKFKIIPDRDYVLWQLPCSENKTGMGYVLCAPDGRNFVIDGGDEDSYEMLCSFIREKCAGEICAWFVTHLHPGHVGALVKLLSEENKDVVISKIFYSHLSLDKVEKLERESLEFVSGAVRTIKRSGITTVSVNAGDRLKLGRTMIRVFSAGDGDYAEHYVNNSGVVYKFNMFCSSILFLGDIMHEACVTMLEKYKYELNCDIVQMANHGIRGALSEVYLHATPDICMWSTPREFTEPDNPENKDFSEAMHLMDALGCSEHHISGLEGLCQLHITY